MIKLTSTAIAALFAVTTFAAVPTSSADAHVLKKHGSERHWVWHSAKHARKHARKAARRARWAARRGVRVERHQKVHPRYRKVIVDENTMEWREAE